jgi:hypothetical protein
LNSRRKKQSVHSGKIFAEVIAKTLVHLAKGTRNSKVHKPQIG